ncbi:flavin reductase family protein [Candidatus Margulisiibacteriota bacterium]
MKKIPIKEAISFYKPNISVFVISVDENDKPNGMITNFNMKASLDPPRFAVGLSKRSYTQELIHKSQEFVIAVANKEMEEDLLFFGTNHGDKVDKFSVTNILTQKATEVRTPLLSGATINFECKVIQTIDAGDHYIFLGEVLAAHLDSTKKVLINLKGNKEQTWIFKEF